MIINMYIVYMYCVHVLTHLLFAVAWLPEASFCCGDGNVRTYFLGDAKIMGSNGV